MRHFSLYKSCDFVRKKRDHLTNEINHGETGEQLFETIPTTFVYHLSRIFLFTFSQMQEENVSETSTDHFDSNRFSQRGVDYFTSDRVECHQQIA